MIYQVRKHDMLHHNEQLRAMFARHHEPGDNEMGACLINFQRWECPALTAYMVHCMNLFNTLTNENQGNLISFAVETPPCDPGWATGYPHHHAYAHYSLVHYLEPGDAYAPLVVFDGDHTDIVTPEAGLTVMFEGSQEHGVLGTHGSPRRTLVTHLVPHQVVIH